MINLPSQPILSTHLINPPSQHTLSTHLLTHPSPSTPFLLITQVRNINNNAGYAHGKDIACFLGSGQLEGGVEKKAFQVTPLPLPSLPLRTNIYHPHLAPVSCITIFLSFFPPLYSTPIFYTHMLMQYSTPNIGFDPF